MLIPVEFILPPFVTPLVLVLEIGHTTHSPVVTIIKESRGSWSSAVDLKKFHLDKWSSQLEKSPPSADHGMLKYFMVKVYKIRWIGCVPPLTWNSLPFLPKRWCHQKSGWSWREWPTPSMWRRQRHALVTSHQVITSGTASLTYILLCASDWNHLHCHHCSLPVRVSVHHHR